MLTFAMLFCCCAAEPVSADNVARAKAFVETLQRGDFVGAAATFDDRMTSALPPPKLKEAWEGLAKQFGALKSIGAARAERRGPIELVYVTCEFEKTKLDIRLAFGPDSKIGGMGFQPNKPPVEYQSPDYVDAKSFSEKEVTLNPGTEWTLPGIVSIPNGKGPFPAVVLVHGSGSHDRDESLGPNKPFRDLAGGLASRGIAVLRYDKRNYVHGTKIKPEKFTIQEEVIDDALAGVALLRKLPQVDGFRVYVLGHSLGAMAAPKMAATDKGIAGIVLMAGAARPLEDVIIDQLTYISSLPGPNSAGAKEMLPKLKEQLARVKDPKALAAMPESERPMGMPPSYWISLRTLDPATTAGKLACRVLVLQGDRDYQVTLEDFTLLERALAGNPKAELRRFANQNHLFMEGQGKATPAEYEKPGHVAKETVGAVADWILR